VPQVYVSRCGQYLVPVEDGEAQHVQSSRPNQFGTLDAEFGDLSGMSRHTVAAVKWLACEAMF
jgi:hypothetical protein